MDKILVIDDSSVQTEFLYSMLNDNYELIIRHTAKEGLETAIKGGYSLVLLDIVMPDISGISLAKELHKQEPAPAVVLMSSIPGFSLEAWKIQAFGFIEKPYTRAHIAGMVEKYIRSL